MIEDLLRLRVNYAKRKLRASRIALKKFGVAESTRQLRDAIDALVCAEDILADLDDREVVNDASPAR